MTAKEYLMEIQRCKRAMETLGQRAEQLRTEMEGLKAITYDKDRVQVSPSNRMEELMPRLIEAEERYGKAIFKYHTMVQTRTEQIYNLGNEKLSSVLAYRYIDGLKWEQIAVKMGYSYRNVIKLHGKALGAFTHKYKVFLVFPY